MSSASVLTKPFTLFAGSGNSDNYYRDIEIFAIHSETIMEENLASIVEAFEQYCNENAIVLNSAYKELLFEAVLIGSFWNHHGGYAYEASDALISVMKQLARLRKAEGNTGKIADTARGILGLNSMQKEEHKGSFLKPGIEGLQKLTGWMEATGEFQREARVFNKWLPFFAETGEGFTFIAICSMRNSAMQIAEIGKKLLGKYTAEVSSFQSEIRKTHHLREDGISVNRSEAEYHIAMLGAYFINQEEKEKFLTTSRKVLLVPACMKMAGKHCKAENKVFGERCTGCQSNCQINQLSAIGKMHQFEVWILKHSSDLSVWQDTLKNTGIVGAACPATLLAGGYELKRLGIPAQCVVLDHCGCKHWTENPAPSSINVSELMVRMGIMEVNNNIFQQTKDLQVV